MFTTNKKDSKNYRIKGKPINLVGSNIQSLMGGRGFLWRDSKNRIGLENPYG